MISVMKTLGGGGEGLVHKVYKPYFKANTIPVRVVFLMKTQILSRGFDKPIYRPFSYSYHRQWKKQHIK